MFKILFCFAMIITFLALILFVIALMDYNQIQRLDILELFDVNHKQVNQRKKRCVVALLIDLATLVFLLCILLIFLLVLAKL